MPKADHWENVYRNKKFDAVSWYAPHLGDSLRLIEQLCPDKTAAIVDIGAGESTLVDDLLNHHYLDLAVLDISSTAIEFTKQRLGAQAAQVGWHVGDVTQYDFGSKKFDLWHDRAVFHFLTDPVARQAYVELVRRSVKPGGYVLMATFGPNGCGTTCSERARCWAWFCASSYASSRKRCKPTALVRPMWTRQHCT